MFAPNGREPFSLHRLSGVRELPQACSPLTGGRVFACIKRGISPSVDGGNVAAPRGVGKRVDTCGFYPLNSRFTLFLSLAHTRDRRPLRNRGTAEDFYYRVFLNLFAVSDTFLLHM